MHMGLKMAILASCNNDGSVVPSIWFQFVRQEVTSWRRFNIFGLNERPVAWPLACQMILSPR